MESINELVNLSGKSAIVTGGAKGIGYGISYRLAESGASVLIADLDEETANSMRAACYDTLLRVNGVEKNNAINVLKEYVIGQSAGTVNEQIFDNFLHQTFAGDAPSRHLCALLQTMASTIESRRSS